MADEMLVARVVRVDGDGGVAEHGFGPRCGDDEVIRARLSGSVCGCEEISACGNAS